MPAKSDTDGLEPIDEGWLRKIRRALPGWYDTHARDLPWRRTRDPYPIWLSEIMLQQTTVVAVIPYFERFLQQFPTVADLAAAEEQRVLRAWEGLGYYRRARNLHRAAQVVMQVHRGQFPPTLPQLLDLPGVGRYTAGAIGSFAFDLRAPIVEANTLRLYSRLLGYAGDPRSSAGQQTLWHFAERVLPAKQPGRFNQALMELGATVCSPVRPACEECPLQRCCVAFAEGTQAEIPRLAARPEVTEVTEIAFAIRRGGQYLFHRRPPGSRWEGLWDLPRFASSEATGELSLAGYGGQGTEPVTPQSRRTRRGPSPSEALAEPVPASRSATDPQWQSVLERWTGVRAQVGPLLTELRHGVTRYRITLRCYHAEWQSGDIPADHPHLHWVGPSEISQYPLSVTGRKLTKLLWSKSL